jgi:hypothetical protein
MKNFLISSFFVLFFLIINIQAIEPNIKNEKIIPNIEINSTIVIESLSKFKDEKYLYFSFDADKFNKIYKNQLSFYFKITTKQQFFRNSLLSKSLSHTSINKNPKNITYSDIEGDEQKLTWQKSTMLYKHKNTQSNQTIYYISTLKISQNPILIIRIPILNIEGDLTIQSILSLPDLVKLIFDAPIKSITKDITDTIKSLQSNKKHIKNNNKNIPKNNIRNDKYRKKDNINDSKKHRNEREKCRINKALGAILLTLWGSLLILYFLTNRRKKTFIVNMVGYNNLNLNNYRNI